LNRRYPVSIDPHLTPWEVRMGRHMDELDAVLTAVAIVLMVMANAVAVTAF
jgi:hypothetical protein